MFEIANHNIRAIAVHLNAFEHLNKYLLKQTRYRFSFENKNLTVFKYLECIAESKHCKRSTMIAVGLMSILLAVVTCVVHLDLFGIFTSRPVHVERLVINDNYMWIPRPGTQTDIQNPRFPYNHEKQEYDDFNPYDGCTMVDLPEGVEPASIQPNEIFDVSDFERVNSDSPDYEDEDF